MSSFALRVLSFELISIFRTQVYLGQCPRSCIASVRYIAGYVTLIENRAVPSVSRHTDMSSTRKSVESLYVDMFSKPLISNLWAGASPFSLGLPQLWCLALVWVGLSTASIPHITDCASSRQTKNSRPCLGRDPFHVASEPGA